MKLLVVDADSQLPIQVVSKFNGWQLPKLVTNLQKNGALFFSHSLFGEHHNMFPILVLKIANEQIKKLQERMREFTKEQFGGAPDIIVYPTESTASLIVKQIAASFRDRPTILPLAPAFRRWNRSSLHLELPETSPLLTRSLVHVLFFDDSISSGRTESLAFETVREMFIGDIKWRTYTLIDRSDTPIKRPSTLSLRGRRKSRHDSYGRDAFIQIGPPSLDGSRCPLCQALARAEQTLEWAAASRRGVVSKLEFLKHILSCRSLHDGDAATHLINEKVEDVTLLLSFVQFQHACLLAVEKTPTEHARNVGKFLFLALNFVDACAYVSHDDLGQALQAAIRALGSDDSDYGSPLLIAMSSAPLALLQAHSEMIFAHLMEVEAVSMGGAVLALLIARHDEEMRKAVRSGAFTASEAEDIQRQFLHTLYGHLTAKNAFIDSNRAHIRQVLISDLNLLRHKPDLHDQLWNVRVLAALLHLGNHQSFLIQELRTMTQFREEVKANLLHCLQLLKRLVNQLSPGRETDIEDAIQKIDKINTADALKAEGEEAIAANWRRYVEAEFIYDAKRLDELIEHARVNAADYLKKEAGRKADGLYDLMRLALAPASLPRWRVFGPHYNYLLEHFQNMFVNAVKHFYNQPFSDWTSWFSRLDSDLDFRTDEPLVWVSFHVDADSEALFLVFSDRAALPSDSKGLLAKYSGLASCRAHLQIKGGDVSYFSATDPHALSAGIAHATQRQGKTTRLNNHFVTQMPIILNYKTSRETKL